MSVATISTTSQGRPSTETTRHPNWRDLSGRTFGRLTALEYVGGRYRKWKCRCECGNDYFGTGADLRAGHTKSCGCLWRRNLVETDREYVCNDCSKSAGVEAFLTRRRRGQEGGRSVCQPCKQCRIVYGRLPDQRIARAANLGVYARKRMELVNTLKERPCLDCGKTFPTACMDFDHVRGTKRLHISALQNRSLTLLLEELEKCELVCSNCHRIRTSMRRAAIRSGLEGAAMSLAESKTFLDSPTYPIVQLEAPFVDERGSIQNITTSGAQSVAVLHTKAGFSRASHVHKTDDHLAWVVSGRVEYWWQDVIVSDGEVKERLGDIKRLTIEAGQAFYTPRHVAHTMHFPVDSVLLTISCKSRKHADHEADLIRIPSLKATEST